MLFNVYGYNLNNESLIFMGQNYLFVKYSIKEKNFIPVVTKNFMGNKDINVFDNYEIKHISEKYIILNNLKEKIIYFIDINSFCLLKKTFTYYFILQINNNYLLFNSMKDNTIQFSLINLNELSNEKNDQLIELINFKEDNNLPKIILNNSFKTFIYLYESNQLCYGDYMIDRKKDNLNKINQNKNIKNIKVVRNYDYKIPKIDDYSKVYNDNYLPSRLFSDENNLYDILLLF